MKQVKRPTIDKNGEIAEATVFEDEYFFVTARTKKLDEFRSTLERERYSIMTYATAIDDCRHARVPILISDEFMKDKEKDRMSEIEKFVQKKMGWFATYGERIVENEMRKMRP